MRSFGTTPAWTSPKTKKPETSESSTPAWKKATQKQESTIYLDEDEDDIAALFFAAGGGGGAQTNTKKDEEKEEEKDDAAALFHSAGGGTTTDAHTSSTGDDDAAALFHSAGGGGTTTDTHTTTTDDDDAAALFFAGQQTPKDDNDAAQDDDSSSSSSSSSSDGSDDDSSRNSENSGSASDDDDSSQRDNDDGDASQSSGSNSSNSSDGKSGGSASGSDDDSSRSSGSEEEVEEDDDRSRSDESDRSDDSSRSENSGSRSSGGERDDDSGSRSSDSGSEGDDRSGDASDDGSRSSRSSASEGSSKNSRSNTSNDGSDSDSSSRSERSDDDSSRSSRSDSGSEASGDAESARGSDASSYEEVEVTSDDGKSEAKEDARDETKGEEKKENAKGASAPTPIPKPVNTKPVKSFPKVQTSSTPPAIKAPDVKAKPAFVKSEGGMAPWQNELKKRKETGVKTAGWKKPKKEEGTIYVDDEDEEDIAAMFFGAGGEETPVPAKFGAAKSSGNNDDDDAAAMFQSAGGQTKAAAESFTDADAAAMFRSTGTTETENFTDDDAAAMFRSTGTTETAAENFTDDDAAAMFRSSEPTETTQDSTANQVGDEEFVEVVEDQGADGYEEVLEEVEDIEEEIIVEEGGEADEEMIIEVEEEFVDEETFATSNEHAAEFAEQQALEERRLAQQRAYEEMERTELQMRNYIASLAQDDSAQSDHSDQSSVPWAMATNGEDRAAAHYASYVQAARQRRIDDQSSYFKPDMEIPNDDSIAETETFASSEQRSIPWGLEVQENDSWANPVRPFHATRKTEALQNQGQKESIDTSSSRLIPMPSTTSNIGGTVSSISRRAPNRRKRRAPTGFGEMVSAEVYKTSVPDMERETELWYHPGFAFLSQNPDMMRPYFPPPPQPKVYRSNSMNDGSEGTDKAVVSDLEIAQHMYSASVPSISNVTLLSYGKKTIQQWNMLENWGRRRGDDHSSFSSVGEESTTMKLPDFSKTILRTAKPWTPKRRDSQSSDGSLSYDMLKPFEDEGSDEEKKKHIVFSRSGSSVSIDLEVETFEYIPESSTDMRPGSSDDSSSLESGSTTKSTRRLPCGIYGFMTCCFCVVLLPTTIALYLTMTGQDGEPAPRATNANFTYPTQAPTMAPTLLNETIEETISDAPSSAGPIPTLQPTVFEPPVIEEPVTEDLLFRLLASASVDNGTALRNRGSPQFAAMEWLRTPAGFNGVSNDAIFLQRYALATFYYSTNAVGETSWMANDLWLSDANVCDWFSSGGSLRCNNNGMVTALTLTNNGLNGNLPNEIGILSQLETIMLSGNAQLTGPVPRTVQYLSNLNSIFIEGTGLSGLPPEVCDLPLQDFW
eukprot:CAMPEP_0113609644 /NCGR_PEP_ID=MMETSP0017_2-20120614/4605_1 /TAXON_ID=2856 /ORGANISM="Cylindrotheca closterium" /LENGTH=1349 /DNA_ID=CAMNT_0000518483 /DNA_START=142 /DNA_END=4188 /DNA_ORIENTATION=+ /assembly_acc=CAM_ASM_000147